MPELTTELRIPFSKITIHAHNATMTSEPLRIKLCTFNLLARPYTKFNQALHNNTAAPVETLDQTAARYALNTRVLRTIAPDIALLQEHDCGLHARDHLHATSSVCAYVDGRAEGCSVLGFGSAVDLRFVWTLDLGEGKTAAFALAAMRGAAGSLLALVSAHLKGGPDTAIVKRKQIAAILAKIPARMPCVLAGDMNETNPMAVFGDLLTDAGFTHVAPTGPTGLNSAMTTPLTIDHVFIREIHGATMLPMMFAPGVPWTPGAAVGSDHVPVVVEMNWPAAPEDGGGGVATSGYSYYDL